MAKSKIVQKTTYMSHLWRKGKRQVKTPRAVAKEGAFVIFDSFLFPNTKTLTIKAFLEVILVSLTLRAPTGF